MDGILKLLPQKNPVNLQHVCHVCHVHIYIYIYIY